MADLGTSHDIEDLRAAIATSRDMPSVMAEADTAHYTLMREIMD